MTGRRVRVAGYIRVSTRIQAEEGYSLPAQQHAITSYCAARGWELVTVYVEAGRSAKTVEHRQELERLLADAGQDAFNCVLVLKWDRAFRNLKELLIVCEQLEATGIDIVSVREAMDTTTPTGRMIRNMLGAVAEFEREVIVGRIEDGLAEKARQGELLGHLPLGYRPVKNADGKTVAVETDPETAPLVAEAFALYASGRLSLRELGAWSESAGLKSRRGHVIDGVAWRKMLTNVAYIGQVGHHLRSGSGTIIAGKHPALVDQELFEAVQVMLRQRRIFYVPKRNFGRDAYPLSALGVCGHDGAPLLGVRSGHGGGERYMRCSTTQRQGRHACAQPMVRADVFEGQIAHYLGGMRLEPERLGRVIGLTRADIEGPSTHEEADRLRGQLQREQRLFVLGDIDEEQYRAESARIRRLLASLERPHLVMDTEAAVRRLRDVGSLWGTASRSNQRDFAGELFQRIEVSGPQVTAIVPKAEYAPLFVADRQERFGGVCSLVPLTGLGATKLHTVRSRTGHDYLIPALVLA